MNEVNASLNSFLVLYGVIPLDVGNENIKFLGELLMCDLNEKGTGSTAKCPNLLGSDSQKGISANEAGKLPPGDIPVN
tara:strand:- start:8 stop:241 length:234 start_codon:yes stop_codon:yes gene_type:complete